MHSGTEACGFAVRKKASSESDIFVLWLHNNKLSMKRWKLSLLTLSLIAFVFGIVLFSACEKDPCTDLKCKNGSACTEGFCRCPTGYEGAECEIKTSSRVLGTFIGYNHCNDLPALNDTLDVRQVAEPNIVAFSLRHSNPTEVMQGTVVGYTIVVPDQQVNNYTIKTQAVVDHDKINVIIAREYGPGNKTVCTFNGTRP
jgi:hypothetical protein